MRSDVLSVPPTHTGQVQCASQRQSPHAAASLVNAHLKRRAMPRGPWADMGKMIRVQGDRCLLMNMTMMP
jgi:hypothetical protein